MSRMSKSLLTTTTVCAVGLATPLTLSAQEGSSQIVRKEIRAGVGYLGDDSFRLGRFTGVDQAGVFLDLGFLLRGLDPHDSDTTRYWRLEGRNLGLDSRSLKLDAGERGRYSTFLYYQQMPSYQYRDVGTPYRGTGSGNLSLPAGGGAATADEFLRDVDLGANRERLSVGGRVNLDTRWRASTAVHYDRKDGLMARGVNNDHFWALQRSAVVPVPVDYETTRFEADVTYDGEQLQGRLGYHLSVFSQRDGQSLDVPDATVANWDNAPSRTVALEPDNQFHQITGSIGYTFTESTARVGADVALGRMTQDERFVEEFAGLPSSLDGQINTTLLNLRASGRPHERLNLRAGYRYDDRDNRTSAYDVEHNGRTWSSRPVSSTQNRYHVDASYRMQDRTYLNLGVVRDERERTFDDRERTDETAYKAGIRTRAIPRTTLSAEFQYAEQRGSNWERDTAPETLRKYYLADRDRKSITLLATFQANGRLQFTPRVQWIDDDYSRSELGLQSAERQIWAMDVSYVPSDRLTAFAFYAYENIKADQDGFRAPTPTRPGGEFWRSQRDEDSLTMGLGGEYVVRPGKLTLGTELIHIESSGRARVRSELGNGVYPSLESRLTQFSLYGDYRLRQNLDFRLRYMVERYQEKDWGLDGVGVTGVGNLILLDQDSPDYTSHLIAGTLRYRF